jgi:hypothetical protein
MKGAVGREIAKHPKRSVFTIILLATLLVAAIAAIAEHQWVSLVLIAFIAVLICVPVIIGKIAKIQIPSTLEVYSVIFIYMTLFLGAINNYYDKFWWWDVLLHISSGWAFGLFGFIILYLLHKSENVTTSPKTVALFSFSFALAMGALWELAEFAMDAAFGLQSQSGSFYWTTMRGGLLDTMKDLLNDSIGALFSAIMGYLYLKKATEGVVKPMVKEFRKDNPRLFKKK